MRFRTEIEPLQTAPVSSGARLLFLGSCFADNMRARLTADGFEVAGNPLGPLFNPISTADTLLRALEHRPFTPADLMLRDGVYHAPDAAARYASPDREALLSALNSEFGSFSDAAEKADTLFVTFGTAYTYRLRETGRIVANCHRLPAAEFLRERLSPDSIVARWKPLCERVEQAGKRIIFTVSPVRHVADGLHGNNLSKAILLLSIDALEAEYFPAYEIVCDDLRDYRFYADDLKHPSAAAIEYIYEKFADTYFTPATKETVRARHAEFLRKAHRPNNTIL